MAVSERPPSRSRTEKGTLRTALSWLSEIADPYA
jgi:hypothetical protein